MIIRFILSLLKLPEYDVKKQKRIIDSFPDVKNDFDRTYYNYKCVCFGRKRINTFILNAIGVVAIPFVVLLYLVNRLCMINYKKDSSDAIIINAKNRLGVQYSYEGRIPSKIYEDYNTVTELKLERFPMIAKGVMTFQSLKVWLAFVFKHPLSGFINLRALINLAGIDNLILKYTPKAIVVSRAELNGMSSLITYYCERRSIDYINFMHGDSRAELSIAFVRFTKFYIWDKDYIDVFDWARCCKEQFYVYTPQIYMQKFKNIASYPYYILYVFSGNEKNKKDTNAKAVRDILKLLSKNGKQCKVRPHPRWSDIEYLEKIFINSGIEVENPKIVNTHASIEESEIIVGTYSTIIAEAFYGGKRIAIDDVSDPSLYRTLHQNKYIMLNKEHELLSQIISLGGN